MKDAENLIWIDLEMTGLNPERDRIIEVATIVTDKFLNCLAEGPVIAVYQSEQVLENMHEWCIHQHGQSGLTERVRESGQSERDAEMDTIQFLEQWVPEGKSPMCGNSICQDRRFLARYMPKLEAYFHYRHIDVSTIKELAARWEPEAIAGFTKKSTHLAMDDIRDSIAELKFYREKLFKI